MRILAVASALLGICSLAHGQSYSQQNQQYYPTWWLNSSAPVVDVTKAEGNFAIANLGQLKWMALQAKYHLDVALADQGGSGATVSSMVAGFGTTGNYVAVNLGQLKAVAKPFYDRLLEVGYNTNTNLKANGLSYLWSSDYPWDSQTPIAQNYSPATIGQLKLAFSFDLVDSDADGNLDYTADVYPAYSETRNTDGDIYPDYVDPEPNALPSPTPLPPAVGNYYVNPAVATSGNGETPATAKKTIEEVRVLLRNVNKAAVNGNIKVNLMPGSYYLKSPITFDSGDSGYGANNIVYQSVNSSGVYAPGLAKIHSGAQLNGWTQIVNSYGQTVWRAYPSDTTTNPDFANLPITLSSLASNTRTIVDTTNGPTETFAWLARQPNQWGPNPRPNPMPGDPTYEYYQIDHRGYEYTADGGKFTPNPQTTPATNLQITYPSGFDPIASAGEIAVSPLASVVWWGPQNSPGNLNSWATKENQLTNIDTSAKKLWLYSYLNLDKKAESGSFSNVPGVSQRYYLQGLPSLLDATGEFFFASDGSYIDYKTIPGVSGAPLIRVPVSSKLIIVNGARNLMFNGIEFAFTQCGPKDVAGAVHIDAGSYISLNQCHIHHVGGHAVVINPGAQQNSVLNSWIHECGIGGIYMLGGIKGSGKITSYNTVSNCLIQNMGCIITDAGLTGGVVLEGTENCVVSNTRVSGSSRYGISLRGDIKIEDGQLVADDSPVSRQNTISDVQIDHCCSDSGDAGALHMVGINKKATASGGNKNTFVRMFIRYTFKNPSISDIGPWGIYVDRNGGGTLHQIFRHIKSRDEDNELTGYHHNANPTQQTYNVTWEGTFNNSLVDWPNIASSANAIPSVFTGAAGPLQ